jgi:hypothetical protein
VTAHVHLHKHVLAGARHTGSSKRYESPYVNIEEDSYCGRLSDLLRHPTRQSRNALRAMNRVPCSAKCPSFGAYYTSWGSIFSRHGGRRGTLGKTALTGKVKISPETNHRTCQAACSVGAQAIRFDHHGTQGAWHGRAGVFDDRHCKLILQRHLTGGNRKRQRPRKPCNAALRVVRAAPHQPEPVDKLDAQVCVLFEFEEDAVVHHASSSTSTPRHVLVTARTAQTLPNTLLAPASSARRRQVPSS